jgi:hypothetical protein
MGISGSVGAVPVVLAAKMASEAALPLCQRLLEVISHRSLPALQTGPTKVPASWLCLHYGGAMVLIERFTAQEIRWKSAQASYFVDTS